MGKYGGIKPYTKVWVPVYQAMLGLLTFSSVAAVTHSITMVLNAVSRQSVFRLCAYIKALWLMLPRRSLLHVGADNALLLAIPVPVFLGVALVVRLLAHGQRDARLHQVLLPVQLGTDAGHALL